MSPDENTMVSKHVPRPDIRISGQNTVLSYRLASFYDLYLAVGQVNDIISQIATSSESFSLKRSVRVAAENIGDGNSGIFIKFIIPKRINDMSAIGSAIAGSS